MSEYPRGYSKPMFPQVNYNYKITYTQSHKLEPFHFQSRAVSTLLQSKKIFFKFAHYPQNLRSLLTNTDPLRTKKCKSSTYINIA